MQLDLQQIAFAHVSRLVLRFADLNGLLKAVQIHLRELKIGLGQQRADELLRDIGGQGALVVGDGRDGDCGLIARGLQAVLAFLAALDQVAEAEVELRVVVDIVGR